MSLINDALKRASQTKPTPTVTENNAPPLRPVDPEPAEPAGPPSWLLFLFPVVLLAVCGIAGVLIYRGWQGSDEPAAVVASARENEPPPAPEPSGVHPSNDWVAAQSETNAATAATATPAVAAVPTEPTFPDLRLQGVFYRPSNPSAMINAKTVYRGDRIDTARVIAIGKNSVTVEWNGERRVLTME